MLVFTLPSMLYRSNKIATQHSYVLEAVSRTSPLYRRILDLLDAKPVHEIPDVEYEEVEALPETSILRMEEIFDDRIFDLRDWAATATNQEWQPYCYTRIRMRRIADSEENDELGIHLVTVDEDMKYRWRTPSLVPEYSRCLNDSGKFHWYVRFDMTAISINDEIVGVFETMLPRDIAEVIGNQGRF